MGGSVKQMQFIQLHRNEHRRQRWQRFWPISWLALVIIIEILLTGTIIGMELWSMIINIKYSFFFIGFITSFFFALTWLSTIIIISCCRRSLGCATYTLIQHILSMIAVIVLLYYNVLFLRQPNKCLWPNNYCNEDPLDISLFGVSFGTSQDINPVKFTLLKIEIVCAVLMFVTCLVYILIYIYTTIRVCRKNTVASPHTIVELGRTQEPPPPTWPQAPRESPPDSEF